MTSATPIPRRIYHLALRDEWQAAVDAGEPYERSTLGKSLLDVGYIHCSIAGQVQMIADLVYRGRTDVILLAIDTSRIQSEIRVENLEGGDQRFPHIYGPLPVAAVVSAIAVPRQADGRLATEPLTVDDESGGPPGS